MSKSYLAAGLLATLAASAALLAGASPPATALVPVRDAPSGALAKLAPPLRSPAARAGQRDYIVQFRDARDGLDAVRRAGARLRRAYAALPMAAITADSAALARLLASPAVTRVSEDLGVRRATEFALPAISADLSQQAGATGSGVGIAVIDSGIGLHPDLAAGASKIRASRVVAGVDFVTGSPRAVNNDLCGHGTLVAGIAAGNGFASAQGGIRSFAGVAPRAHLINLRVLDQHGQGRVSNAIAALDWCIRNRARFNIRVVNLSLGHPPRESYLTDPLCQAAEAAWKAGIVVVCAAGNRGRAVPNDPNGGSRYGTINSPGIDPYVITVGATKDAGTPGRADDTVTTYSGRGPTLPDHIMKPDVVAPGNRIVGLRRPGSELERATGRTNLVDRGYYLPTRGAGRSDYFRTDYFVLSGTSMASAFVAGAAALMIEKDPSLTPDTVKLRLMVTARKL